MAIKLLTLNVENDRHLARVQAVIAKHLPDVVCLQEALQESCAYLASSGGYAVKYALSGLQTREPGLERAWGVAVLTRVPVREQTIRYYSEDSRIRILRDPNDPRRALIVTELEHQGLAYRIATTHFTWTADGHINELQKADFPRLKQVLSSYSDYVLCGDFNAPRGREMFSRFVAELPLTDHLPASVTSTLDPQFHKVADLQLAVDTIFSTEHYDVLECQVLEGISDHKALLARIERRR
ncbi:endonuclease/exonuclease/phosphatase family protein [Steroidobacter sp.]|uniref:endonuclease/exonuclease/phosphatase family protein n=1 Tax=Steroidobacter sp. TaxID=1978227 RepID=UPI001A417722|nr:endonuclease/exonuclease/phosphatase family protein [Steroidobacter sp.]MBL8271913.1 endonuclease/exonuclease/phosphatase family protein [Steroidobacter sp.]